LFFKRTDQLAQAGSSKKCVVKKELKTTITTTNGQ
jgi:hypothetical protein